MPRFDFYLLNYSFQSPAGTTSEELGERVEYLAIDCESIRSNGETIYYHPDIYDTPMFEDFTFTDIVYNGQPALSRDQRNALQIIVDRSKLTQMDNEFIIEILVLNNADEVNALLCLFLVKDTHIPPDCQIYSYHDWIHFHRDYFVKYPPARTDFCSSLSPWFSNLFLNPDTIPAGLRGLHSDHTEIMRSLIYHLSALNDIYYPYFMENRQMGGDGACDYLENYFRSHEVRIGASRDGNKKEELYQVFIDKKTGEKRRCYCDLHTKFYQYFEYSDPSYQAKGNRIYFHQPIDGFIGTRLLVGRIGKHA